MLCSIFDIEIGKRLGRKTFELDAGHNLNRDALLRVVAALFAMAGLASGGVASRLTRGVRCAVLRQLRPSESDLRRLIVVAARILSVTPRAACPAPTQPIPRGSGARPPVFALIDPRKQFGSHERRYAPRVGNAPRLILIGWDERVYEPPKPELSPDDVVDAARLSRRLLALKHALDDLPAQARRLVRMKARRKLHAIRPGRPPGYREKPRFEVDKVLAECQWLGLQTLKSDAQGLAASHWNGVILFLEERRPRIWCGAGRDVR